MYVERPPTADLAGRVACVWHQVSEADATQLVVPDACVDLIWGPEGVFVAGPDTGPMPTPMASGDTFVGIRFRPGAVGGFFGVPLQELRDQRVRLCDLPSFRDQRVRVSDPPPLRVADVAAPGRLDVMLAAVRDRLAGEVPADPAGAAIAGALRKGRTVGEVAWDLGFSERQLHRRSLATFGYAPKILQRIVRFQRALTLARAGVPLAEVAVTAGYADQAHLSHDVKRLSGVSMRHLVSPAG
ncbi:helix-turn-helix transcriptional regulator [Nonomuraea jabiensis]|uniref:AraC-like DNA-binding protein n=1 Tax=Nonomuraea jabiensis TaxID=882448 RepID=A0A7W9G6U3_9ACTN|nr:helix-turn-helix transcriptional regulator [Nonomuraea jabiensis]MBB5778176.1 AraC-like DNA-binding protein [Nonomuraea jabiensis]